MELPPSLQLLRELGVVEPHEIHETNVCALSNRFTRLVHTHLFSDAYNGPCWRNILETPRVRAAPGDKSSSYLDRMAQMYAQCMRLPTRRDPSDADESEIDVTGSCDFCMNEVFEDLQQLRKDRLRGARRAGRKRTQTEL